MALQFTPAMRNIYASSTFNNYTSTSNGSALVTPVAQNSIMIYSGAQPSAADFIANYNTAYRPTAAATQLLAIFNNAAWTRTQNHFVITTFPTATVPLKAGTAAWAVLHSVNWTSASLDTATWPVGRCFTLVPVSTITGNGVIRFVSLNFDPSAAVTLIDGGFSIL